MDAPRGKIHSKNILATDLDGTLIPMDGCVHNAAALAKLSEELAAAQVPLIFVTGRHLRSIERAIEQFHLPMPDWVVADVGTSVYERDGSGAWTLADGYSDFLQASVGETPLEVIRFAFDKFDELTLQAPEKQGRLKLSYYCARDRVDEVAKTLQAALDDMSAPYAVTSSLDPFTTHGLIDVLTRVASKAAALQWWADKQLVELRSIVYAGDSGNDFAALASGFRSIVVANAEPQLIEAVQLAHATAGWDDRLYVANEQATSGVLEGCRWFKVL